jgi:4-hydroxy-2-oxoheptanedioate aldolase
VTERIGAPKNRFKARLKTGTQIGLWLSLGEPTVTELAAGTGYDWLVIDAEHAPNGVRDVLAHLRAAGDATPAVVRPRDDNRALVKQLLDIGAQTLLIPMIESADQARRAVASVRYPPVGARGVAGSIVRASGYGARADYMANADSEICLLLQVENRAGLAALDEILTVEGVDGVFIGPADLAADLGHPGDSAAPAVLTAIDDALARIRAAGVAAGILITDPDLARIYHDKGVDFLAVGADVAVLREGLTTLRDRFA